MARKAATRGRRGGRNLKVVSTSALRAELERRASQVGSLQARYRDLASALAQVESELAALGAAPGGRGGRGGRSVRGRRAGVPSGRKRHQNDSNLEQALAKVLKGKTMGVTEVAAAVQDAGYKTTSPNFRTIVNQALLRSELIKKVSRGKYTAA